MTNNNDTPEDNIELPGSWNGPAHMKEEQEAMARLVFADKSEGIYSFHRADGFYFARYADDGSAVAGAKLNPGTLEVVNCHTGEPVFEVHSKS